MSTRRAFAVSLVAAVGAAAAPAAARPKPGTSTLWGELVAPHGEEVDGLLTRARRLIERSTREGTLELHTRALDRANDHLRRARALSPENPEVLALLGTTADELGQTRAAIEALTACVQLRGPERAGVDVTGRLGAIYLRLGRLDDAVRWLRHAQGPITIPDHAAAAIHLATALAARGQMADAIDVLAATQPTRASLSSEAVLLVGFALAVLYDRDEQSGAAFGAIDRLRAVLQLELGAAVQRALQLLRFAPAEDAYYYRGLLYEALGNAAEARTEWLHYAAVQGAAWRPRALAHVAAIDHALRAPRAPAPSAAPSTAPALAPTLPGPPP